MINRHERYETWLGLEFAAPGSAARPSVHCLNIQDHYGIHNCTWICPKCEFFNFSDSFFGEQVNLETENRFVPLTKEKKIGPHLVVQIKAALLVG